MSNWTHVAGIIRIDAIRLDDHIPDFDKLIGKECLFQSPMKVWDDQDKYPEQYLPMGSEGTLQKSIWVNPNKSNMTAYTVSIFGDLRDHEDPHEITRWFKNVCDKLAVRNAVITVANEVNGSITYTYRKETL